MRLRVHTFRVYIRFRYKSPQRLTGVKRACAIQTSPVRGNVGADLPKLLHTAAGSLVFACVDYPKASAFICCHYRYNRVNSFRAIVTPLLEFELQKETILLHLCSSNRHCSVTFNSPHDRHIEIVHLGRRRRHAATAVPLRQRVQCLAQVSVNGHLVHVLQLHNHVGHIG